MNKIKYIFLFLLFPIILFGDGYEDLTSLYIYGDVGYLKFIMTGIQKAVESDWYDYFIKAVSLIAIIMIGIQTFQKKDLNSLAINTAFSLSIIGALHYTSTVNIEDQRVNSDIEITNVAYSANDGIPSILAVMYGTSTIFQAIGINLVNDALETIDSGAEDYSTKSLGYAKALTTLLSITDIATKNTYMDHDPKTAEFARATQSYILDCVLQQAIPSDHSVASKLKNPDSDIFDVIEADNIGLDDDDKITYDGNEVTCENFWKDHLSDKESETADILTDKMGKLVNLDLSQTYTGINKLGNIELNSSALGDGFGEIKAYIVNSATISLTNKAITQNGSGIVTNLDLANSITNQSALANVQTAGLGTGKWFATIAPYIFHILFGVILFYGLFVPPIAIMLGATKGVGYILSYFGGLIGFAAVGIGMAVSSDIVSYFAQQHMVELVATLGGNQATATNINQYYMDLATYTGVSGFLGATIALIAPSLILKGQSSSAISAMGSLSSAYRGGVESASDIASEEKATKKAYQAEQEELAKGKLNKLGMHAPANMSSADYYNKVQEQIGKKGGAWGTFNHSDDIGDVGKSAMYQQEQRMGQAHQFASDIGSKGGGATAYGSGQVQGTMQAGSMEADNVELNAKNSNGGVDKNANLKRLGDGSRKQALQKLSSIGSFGDKVSDEDAMKAGEYDGGGAASKVKGALRHMSLNENWQDDLDTIAKKDADSKVGAASAINMAKEKFGDAAYITSTAAAELSNVTQSLKRVETQGGIEESARISGVDSAQKAAQQKGAVDGLQSEAEKIGQKLGKSAAQVLEDTAKRLSASKIEKDVGTIQGAKTRGGIEKASFKAGIEGGSAMGAAYDNMSEMIDSNNPNKIAQTLKNRTSATDTKRHLVEDIGVLGLDKFNKALGTDFNSETAAAVALMGGGAIAAEGFQLLRGQKGPISGTIKATKSFSDKYIFGKTPQETNSHQTQNSVNQNDSTHNNFSSSDELDEHYNEEAANSQKKIDKMDRENDRDNKRRELIDNEIKTMQSDLSSTPSTKEKEKLKNRIESAKLQSQEIEEKIDDRHDKIKVEEERKEKIEAEHKNVREDYDKAEKKRNRNANVGKGILTALAGGALTETLKHADSPEAKSWVVAAENLLGVGDTAFSMLGEFGTTLAKTAFAPDGQRMNTFTQGMSEIADTATDGFNNFVDGTQKSYALSQHGQPQQSIQTQIGSVLSEVGTTVEGAMGTAAGFAKDTFNALNQDFGPSGGTNQIPGSSTYSPTPIGQALTQQITQGTQANTQVLSQGSPTPIVNTVDGTHAITTNGKNMTIGGIGTQVPSADFQQAMQNPEMRDAFSQVLAQSNLENGGGYGMNGMGATNMQDVMQTLMQNNSVMSPNTSLEQLQGIYGSGGNNGGGLDMDALMQKQQTGAIMDQTEEALSIVEDLQSVMDI